MYNLNNKNWFLDDLLKPNKNKPYYYDFGTGKKVEKEEVKKTRDDFLDAFNEPETVIEREKEERNDPFAFNEPEYTLFPLASSEKPKFQNFPDYSIGTSTPIKYADKKPKNLWYSYLGGDLVSNRDKETFLDGFVTQNESLVEKAMREMSAKNTEEEESFFSKAKDTAKGVIKKGMNILDKEASKANEKGFFDDVTNAFFKASDLSQDYPIKGLPTDLVHQILARVNHKENQKIDLSGYEADGGYINDQNVRGSQSGKIRYGSGTFNKNGCEIIAVNNALVSLGNRKDIRDIARDFETDGQVLYGALGTSPFEIGNYFKKKGYSVKTYEGDKEILNAEIPNADTYIMSFWNSDKLSSAIHTVSMDKLPNGKYRIYNEGWTPTRDIDSLNDYFLERNRVPLILHCIKKGQ